MFASLYETAWKRAATFHFVEGEHEIDSILTQQIARQMRVPT
jgi:hypothetical protein